MVTKPKKRRPPQIISLEEDDDYVNLLVYGRSGVGKTVFAGSAQKVLFLAPEDDGTISAKRLGSKASKIPILSWNDLQGAYEWLYDTPDHGFDWVAIDSLTEMQEMLLRQILDDVVKDNPNRDLDIPAIADHQKWQNKFKRFVKAFNALPVNMLYTALVRSEEDEEGETFLTPAIQGKGYEMSQKIASYMTSYGCMQVKRIKNPDFDPDEDVGRSNPKYKKVRRITWEDTGPIQGKDRTTVLAPYTQGMNLQQITDLIMGTNSVESISRKRAATKRKAS